MDTGIHYIHTSTQYKLEQVLFMESAFIFNSTGGNASRGILDIFRGLSDIAVV
jgi:hypothetical protein